MCVNKHISVYTITCKQVWNIFKESISSLEDVKEGYIRQSSNLYRKYKQHAHMPSYGMKNDAT